MRTLVIHPDDRSTDFLKAVYKDIPDATVITGGLYQYEVDAEIMRHDRIIILGHGTPSGLLSVGQFLGNPSHIVDDMSAKYLADKKENIYIWCYASDYVKKHKLTGFASGMFISEVGEANYCGIPHQTKKDIDIQCEYFCNLVGAAINMPSKELYKFVSQEFGEMTVHCKVAEYNHRRLYLAERIIGEEKTIIK